jgi:hypothetical protein
VEVVPDVDATGYQQAIDPMPQLQDLPFSSGRTATPVSFDGPGNAPTPETCSPGRAPRGSSEGIEVLKVADASQQIVPEL